MSKARKITDLVLNFEEHFYERLMEWQIEGIHIWPSLRTPLFTYINTAFLGASDKAVAGVRDIGGQARIIYKMLKNGFKRDRSIFFRENADLVFLTSARFRSSKKEGKAFDYLYDYLGIATKRKVLFLEESYQLGHVSPEYCAHIKYLDHIYLVSMLKASSPTNFVRKQIFMFIEFLMSAVRGFFPLDCVAYLESNFPDAFYWTTCFFYSDFLERIIVKTNCRWVFINTCSFGGARAFLAKRLRGKRKLICEYQHGLISVDTVSYAYRGLSPSYLEYLPDYFLIFGEYWANLLDMYPSKKYVIGYPFLDDQVRSKIENNKRKVVLKKILILSQGVSSGKWISLVKKLTRVLPQKYEITFRLHPTEVAFLEERRKELGDLPRVTLQFTGTIYDLFQDHDIIIGEFSTAIMEALPFEKRIYIWDTELSRSCIPHDIGQWFQSVDDLVDLILDGLDPSDGFVDWRYYWADNWRDRFEAFLKETQ